MKMLIESIFDVEIGMVEKVYRNCWKYVKECKKKFIYLFIYGKIKLNQGR